MPSYWGGISGIRVSVMTAGPDQSLFQSGLYIGVPIRSTFTFFYGCKSLSVCTYILSAESNRFICAVAST